MSRREESNDRRSRYASVKKWVEKQGSGSAASYLKVPKGMSIFQPKVGIMLVDILPYEVGKGNPMAEEGSLYWERTFFVHRGIGPNQEMVICPARTLNQPCPICEYRSRLSRSEDDEDIKEASTLNAKERQVFNVINRKEPDKGVQLWTTSFHTFGKELQAELTNADEQDHWDLFFTLDQGYTLKIGFGEDSMGRSKFITADTIHFKDRKPLDEKDILDQVALLDDILIIKSYDELEALFTQSQGKDKDDEPRGRRGRSRDAEEPEEPRRRRSDPDLEPEPESRGRSRSRGVEEPDEPRRSRREEPEPDEPRSSRGRAEEPEPEPRGRRSREEEPEPEPRAKGKADDWDSERAPRGRRDDPEPEAEPEPRRSRREEAEPEPERAPRRGRAEEEPEPEARGKGKAKGKDKADEGAVDDGWDNFDKEPRRSRRDDPEPEPEPEPRGRSRREDPEPEARPRVRSEDADDKGRARARR